MDIEGRRLAGRPSACTASRGLAGAQNNASQSKISSIYFKRLARASILLGGGGRGDCRFLFLLYPENRLIALPPKVGMPLSLEERQDTLVANFSFGPRAKPIIFIM